MEPHNQRSSSSSSWSSSSLSDAVVLTTSSTGETDIKILGEHGSRTDHFYILEENERHRTAPAAKRRNSVKVACSCFKRGNHCEPGSSCENRAFRQECYGQLCMVHREDCCNRSMQRREWRNVEVRDAGEKGYGLFAGEALEDESFVLEYLGEIIGQSEFVRRSKDTGHRYFMLLDEGEYLDPSRRGSIARFMNHSCEPNCTMEVWTVKGELRACVYTKRAIAKDEELVFDYAWEPMARKPLNKCFCGTPSCRLFIEDWESFDRLGGPAAHRIGTWEVPPGAPMDLHMSLKGCGSMPRKDPVSGQRRRPPLDERLVDRRVRVWWDGNGDWFDADIIGYDPAKKLHKLQVGMISRLVGWLVGWLVDRCLGRFFLPICPTRQRPKPLSLLLLILYSTVRTQTK
jgi:hypothetical protein